MNSVSGGSTYHNTGQCENKYDFFVTSDKEKGKIIGKYNDMDKALRADQEYNRPNEKEDKKRKEQ